MRSHPAAFGFAVVAEGAAEHLAKVIAGVGRGCRRVPVAARDAHAPAGDLQVDRTHARTAHSQHLSNTTRGWGICVSRSGELRRALTQRHGRSPTRLRACDTSIPGGRLTAASALIIADAAAADA